VSESTATVKALAPWFGGKRNLAAWIVAELGEHTCYWEPFCGSMAVLLAKQAVTMETVNDLHGDLVNLAEVIRDPCDGPILYRRLRRTLMDEAVFKTCDSMVREQERLGVQMDTDRVSRAYCYFDASWLGRSGCAGQSAAKKGTYCVRFTKNGGHAAKRFRSAVDSIPAWRRRLRNVTILSRDGFGLLERIEDAEGTAIYVDPPYLVKGAEYLHDFELGDHRRLAELLHRFDRARVVVSYYAHQALSVLYPGWTRVSQTVPKALAHQRGRGANEATATEVLLINGRSYTRRSAEPSLFAV